MKEEDLSIQIANKECMCFKCRNSGGLPAYCKCLKYKFKPLDVLYANAKCPKFVLEPELEEGEEDDDE